MINLPIILLATAMGSSSENDHASAESPRCREIGPCLELFTDPAADPQRRYWAKIFLDRHSTEHVVAAIAPMLTSNLSKMRNDGWWYVISNREAWQSRLPLLLEAVELEPAYAYAVADIGGDAAWDSLKSLAATSSSATDFAGALVRIDENRAAELGFRAIAGDFFSEDPDGLVDGVFRDFYIRDTVDGVRTRLREIVFDPASDEVQRRAVRAYSLTHFIGDGVPALVEHAYETGPESVRLEITTRYGHRIASDSDIVMHVERALDRGDTEELIKLGGVGESGRRLSERVTGMLFDGPVTDQLLAASALHEIDREAWRRLLPRLASHPDILVALSSTELAISDSAESGEVATVALGSHWFPGLPEIAQRRYEASRMGSPPYDPLDDASRLEVVFSNDAVYAKPLTNHCKGIEAGEMPGVSVWTAEAALKQAATEADVRDHVSAAFRTDDGWIVGIDRGEFGGLVVFSPDGAERQLVATVSAEPKLIFESSGVLYAFVGGDYIGTGAATRLDRLDRESDGYAHFPLLHLPAAPNEVVVDGNRVLARLVDIGWVDLSDPSRPHWVGCHR